MREAVKIKVDESGATVESRVVMVGCMCGSSGRYPPRYFILDSKFWVVMLEKGKHPYLCAQVVDPQDE
jgi:hypothetical protein